MSESEDDQFEKALENFEPLTDDEQGKLARGIRELLQEGPWGAVEFKHRETDLVIAFDVDERRGIYSCMIIPEGTTKTVPSVILESTGPRMAVFSRIVQTGTEHQALDDDPGRVRRGDVEVLREFFQYRERFDLIDSMDSE